MPQALVVEGEDGELRYRPLEADVLRLFESPITIGSRHLQIDSERGESHQALLALGALPEVAMFPGREAELLFAPVEALGFAVDACFSARHIANTRALALARRRIVDADHMLAEESEGDHGPTSKTAVRPGAARELEQYLTGDGRPPLLRASISLALGAPTRELLEERVEALRREYGSVRLHRPLGEQLELFVSHLPAQRSRVPSYDDYLTVEQFGAMVPTATHAVGSTAGPYIGHTLSGSRQPVLFDLSEASRTSRPPSILCAGTLGSGKTMLLELLLYQAFLQGSRIVDIDPKGDHYLDALPGVAEHSEVIELSAAERFRGLLDPLRIAPEGSEEDLATNFLIDVLPEPMPAAWKTEIRRAVRETAAHEGAGCAAVIAELMRGNRRPRTRALRSRCTRTRALRGLALPASARPTRSRRATSSSRAFASAASRARLPARPRPSSPRTSGSARPSCGW